jgi:hypothetical protein
VTRGAEFLDVLAEGGSAYHFFGRSADKIALKSRRLAAARERADAQTLRTLRLHRYPLFEWCRSMSVYFPREWNSTL